jgi:exosortase A-associated hydrolase 1
VSYSEEAALFPCADAMLLGITSVPDSEGETGVVVIVGGPQYRVGSHRQFVLLARSLANSGHPVLRFDHRGIGDNGSAQRDFCSISEDIGCAIDHLTRRFPRMKRVVLWGLCDGASAALLYWHETRDRRVGGMCLLNPWVRSDASLAETHVKHYYTRRLMQREFWVKLARGAVARRALTEFVRSLRLAIRGGETAQESYQQRMASAWGSFDGSVLLVLSGGDLTAKEFLTQVARDGMWAGALQRPCLERLDLPEADHTLSDAAARRAVEVSTVNWIKRVLTPEKPP